MQDSSDELDQLTAVVADRSTHLFADSLGSQDQVLRGRYEGKSVLITGGAGFIATRTLRQLLAYEPAVVVIADSSENGLAEQVRDLRSSDLVPPETRLEVSLADVTSPMIDRVVTDLGPFDQVLAFAAAKHVRSERDAISALHLMHVNICGTRRTAEAVTAANPEVELFVVSTDKAADPASLMGASKRVMEDIVLGAFPRATSTRFANVAFSSGSLLESWLIRLGKGQPLPVPENTQRYFVSPSEAGRLCLLASVAPGGSITVPAAGAVRSVELTTALERLLSVEAYESTTCPVLHTPRDTAGEKQVEVFVGADEVAESWLPGLDRITHSGSIGRALDLYDFIGSGVAAGSAGPSMDEILARTAHAVPTMLHEPGRARLDDRV